MIRYLEDYLDLIGSFETLYRYRPGRGHRGDVTETRTT
jgi:hypothetical protein